MITNVIKYYWGPPVYEKTQNIQQDFASRAFKSDDELRNKLSSPLQLEIKSIHYNVL